MITHSTVISPCIFPSLSSTNRLPSIKCDPIRALEIQNLKTNVCLRLPEVVRLDPMSKLSNRLLFPYSHGEHPRTGQPVPSEIS
jgi:hypothetical protein